MAICEVESEFQGEWIRCFKVSDLDLDFMKHWDKVNTSNLREAGSPVCSSISLVRGVTPAPKAAPPSPYEENPYSSAFAREAAAIGKSAKLRPATR